MRLFVYPPTAVSVTVPPIAYTEGGVNTPVTPLKPLPVMNPIAVKEYSTLDTAITPVDASAWVEFVSSTISEVKKIQFFIPSGASVLVGIGAAGSEVESGIIAPGGWELEVNIPAGETISLKTVSGVVDDGLIVANLLG